VSVIVDHVGSITRGGYERLQAELDELVTVRRGEVARWLREAREDGGDPGENGDLGDALDEQALLERRIAELRHRLAVARVVDRADDGTAGIGSYVRLRTTAGHVLDYQLVGAHEGDPARRLLSVESPVGQALLGRSAGDAVDVQTPGGTRRFELLAVDSSAEALAA
jgi:transcription elongation factor GreA